MSLWTCLRSASGVPFDDLTCTSVRSNDCMQLLAVDNSGSTTVAVASLLQSLSEAPGWGPPEAAQRLLPLLVPQLVAASLTPQQLSTVSGVVQVCHERS
jgi:hypothetical protein